MGFIHRHNNNRNKAQEFSKNGNLTMLIFKCMLRK